MIITVVMDDDKIPWKNPKDLLESVVHYLEKEWNYHYEDIEEAFKPYHENIFYNLQEKQGEQRA